MRQLFWIGFFGEVIFKSCLERHSVGAFLCWTWTALQSALAIFGVWMGNDLMINAFHPSYVKTYHPELLSSIKKDEAQKLNGSKFGALSRAKKPSIEITEFHVYSKAGMPKGVKK